MTRDRAALRKTILKRHTGIKAAEQGNAVAQFGLGFIYANGKGVPQNYTQAVYWYQKAAEQGLASAQVNLGLCMTMGKVSLKVILKPSIGIKGC